MDWGTIGVWVAVILLLDASFGLWNHDRFSRIAPKINIFRIALLEAAVAFLLLIVRVVF